MSEDEKASVYMDASIAAMSAGDLAGALSYCLQAEDIKPSRWELQHLKALIFAARGDRPTALLYARKALDLNPKASAALNTYGKLLMEEGRGGEAVPYFIQAGQDPLNREAYKAWTNLGIYYYQKHDTSKALEYFDDAIASSALGSCVAFYYRGHIRLSQSRIKDAIQDYDTSTRKYCAGFADGHLALGIAYERDKQYDRARRVYLEIMDQFKDTNPQVAEQATNHLKYLP